MNAFINRVCHLNIARITVLILIGLVFTGQGSLGHGTQMAKPADYDNLSSAIHDAVNSGNIEKVRALLKAHPNWPIRWTQKVRHHCITLHAG